MTDNKDQKDATPRSTLSVRRPVEGGGNRVKQSFSGGVTKSVAVEVARRRVLKPGETPDSAAAVATPISDAEARRLDALKNLGKEPPKRTLAFTPETVLAQEKQKEIEREKAEAEIRKTLTPEELRARELAELAEIEAAENARQADTDKRRQSDTGFRNPNVRTPVAAPRGAGFLGRTDDEDDRRGPAKNTKSTRGRGDDKRRDGRMTITQALSGDPEIERGRSVASFRRKQEKDRRGAMAETREKITRDIILPEFITVQELASRMTERSADVVKTLMKLGMMVTVTQTIDADTAELVATEMGHTVKRVADSDVEDVLKTDSENTSDLVPRPPVVTIMGHVDHGKTSLLDAIRRTDVVAGEAGGITQHIGAYQITAPSGKKITFIDTPGHAAFTEMRARGANTTDIVVLVVAADDGIMPQTVEAISHAKAAKVPIIVAVNKVDLPSANVRKVKEALLQHDLVVEELGGDVMVVEVSAKKKIGLDKLEETILLQAEVMELKANAKRAAAGAVLEAKLEQGKGPVATVLVQKGTLNVGDIFVSGTEWGRVRALLNDRGDRIQSAIPGMPVEVLGASGAPLAGDDFAVVENENKAREIAEYRARKKREAEAARLAKGSVENMFAQMQAGQKRELAVIIKGDVFGSIEAIDGALAKLAEGNAEVSLRTVHRGVGAINESDITLATATKALIIGFNVRANPQARDIAKRDGIDIRYYSIIYNAIDDVKALLSGLLSPVRKENIVGYATIREVFNLTKAGKVAGCYVTEGKIKRGGKVRLLRDGVVIHEGTLKTLKRMKDDAREVAAGFECGAAFENYEDIKVGDQIECIEIEETAATL